MAGRKRWLKATIAGVEAKLDLKIGDLVLAKVKGFPAWPAKISDPEDWGVSPDSRKIFVHYFGTNQIGFCKKSELRAWNRDAKRSVQEKSESKNATADYCRAAREILEVDEKRSSEVNFVDTGQINTDEQSESRIAERTPSITLFGVGNSGGLRDDIPEDNFVNTGQSNTDEQPKSRIIERTPNIILFKRVKSRTARSANRVLEAVNATNSDCGDIRLTSDETLAVQNGCSLGTQQVKLSSGKGNNSMERANGDAKVQDTQLAKNPKIVINYQKRSSRLVKCSSFVQSEKEAKNSHLDTALRVSTRETDSSHFDDANKDNTFRETGETTAAENTTMDLELIAFGRESNAKNEDETKVEVGLAEISMDSELSVFGREANAKNEDETKVRVGLAEIPVDSELSVFGREANAKNEDETKMKVGLAEIPRDIIPFRRRNFRKRKYTSWMLEQDADIWNDERASTEGAKVAQNQESMELPENTVSKVGNGITTACLPVDDSVDTGLLKFCRRANLGHRNANRKIGSVEISENENPPIRTDLRISGTIQDQKDVLGVFFGTHISDNQVQKRRTESLEQRSARLDQTSTGEKANYIEFNELEKSHIEMKKVIENPCVSDQLLDLDRYSTMENIGTNAHLAETCEKLGSHITMNTLNFEPCDEKRVPAKASMNSEPLEVDNGLCGLNCDDIFDRDVGENYSLTKENAKGEMKTNKGDSDLVSSEVSDMGNTFMKQENLHHASKCSGLHAAIEHKKEAISTTKEDQMEQDADNLKEKGASAEDANVPQNQESVELPEGMVLKASINSKACLPVNGSIDTGLVKFRRRTISRYQNVNCKMGSVEISDSENPRQRPDSRKTRIAGSIQDSCVSNELLNLDINPTKESTTTNAHVAEVCEKLSSQSTVNTQNFESCVEKRVTAKALMNSKPFENDKNSFRLSCDDKFDRDVGENPYLAKESRKGEMKTIVEGSGIMGSEVTVMENTCKGQETLHHGPKCSGVPASNEQTKEAVSATIIDRKDEEADNLNDMRASTDAKLPRNQDCMELPEGVVSKAGIDIETRSPVDGSVDIELVRFCRRANSGCWNVDSKISSVEISVSENPPKRAYLRNTRSSGSIQDQKDNLGALCRTHMAAKRGQKRRRSESLEQRDVGPEQAFAREKIDCIEFNDLSQSQVEIQAIVEDPGVSDQLLNVDRNPTVEDTSTNAQLAETGEKLSSNINMNLNNFESCYVKRVSAKVSMNSEPLEDDNDLCVLNCDAIFVRDLGENSSLAKENKISEMKINEEDSDVGNICTEQESMQNTIEDMKEAISATKGNQMEQDADNLKKEGISAEDAKVELPEDVVSKTSTNITKACLGSDASVDIGRVKLCRRANSGYQNLNSKVGCIEISDSANPPKRPHLRNTRSSCSIQDQKDVLGALCRTHMSANRGWKRRKTESLEQRDARLEQACTGEKINCIEFNELKQGQVKIQTIMEDPCISNELLDLGRHPTTENTATNAKLAEVCERLSTHVTMNTQYFEYCDENRIPIQASMNSKPLEDDKDLGGLNCDDMFARDVEETPLAKDNPKGEMKTNEEYNGIMVKNCIEQENLDHTANEQTKKAVSASKVDQKCCEEAEILHLDNKTEIIEEQKQAAVLSTLLKPETALLDSDVWHNTSKEIEERSSNQFNAFSVNAPTVPAERNAGVDSCCFYNSKVNGNGTPKPNSFEKREASEMCNKLNEKDSQNLQLAAIMPQFKNFQEGSTADEEQLEGSRDGLLAAMQTRFSVQFEDIDANDFSGCYDWTVQGNCPNMAQETQEETEMQEQQLEPSYGSLNGKEAMLKDEQTGVMEASALKQIVKQTRLSPAAMPLESRGCIHIVENLDPSDDDVGNLERQGSSVLKEFQEVNKQLTLGQTGLNNKMKSLKQTEMEIEKNQLISHLKESTKMKNESSASLISTLKIKGDDTFSRTMQEIEVAKEAKHQIFTKDGEVSACSSSMRYLIAVAQAKRQAKIFHVSSLCQNVELEKAPSTPLSEGVKYSDASTHTTGNSAIECIDEEKIVSRHLFTREDQKAVMARATLEAMLRTLTRTKESISKATRHAVECVKHGIAQQAIELIVRKLELESSFSRRIDLFFLIDSITQCSHQAKGIEATIYPSAVQKLLPRLLKAAAPSGIIARENRRQCLRVLRIWLQRNVMPEAFLKPFIGELEVHSDEKVVGKHHCPPRCQRSVDDPIREMEGMQVDEYGSNAAFSLPGLLSQLCDDEEDISDGVRKDGDHSSDCIEEEIELTNVGHKAGKYNKHILEDVDGELEMEVSPSSNGHGGHRDCEMSNYGQYPPLPPMPCPPDILPPSPPPLPLSPPPSPPPPPPPSPPPNMASSTYYHSVHTSANSVFPHVNQPQYTSQLGFESGYSFPKFSPFTTVSSSVTGSHVEKYSQPQSTASNSSTPAFRTALNPFFRADSASYAQASINQSLHGNQEVSSQCIQSPHADRDYPSTSILCPKAKPWQISQVDSVRSFYHQTSPIPRERPNITRGTSRYRHDTGSSYGQYDDHFSHIQLQQPPQPVRGGGLENYKPQQGAIRQGYWRLNGTKDYNG